MLAGGVQAGQLHAASSASPRASSGSRTNRGGVAASEGIMPARAGHKISLQLKASQA